MVLLLALIALGGTARAQTQVSSEFRRVAKGLAKRIASDELSKVCKGKKNPALCEAMTDSVAPVFEMAIEGSVDETALSGALVELASRLTQVIATEAAKQKIATLVAEVERGESSVDPSALAKVAGEVSSCVTARVLQRSADACQPLRARLAALKPCQEDDAKCGDYSARLLLSQVGRLLDGSIPSGFYAAVSEIAATYDTVFAGIDSPNDASVFDAEELNTILAHREGEQVCTKLPALRARVAEWQAGWRDVFVRLSKALASFQTLPADQLARLPVDLPDAGCPMDHPIQRAANRLQRFAETYRTDLKVVALLDPVMLPALLGALLVDYVHDHDTRALHENARDLSLRLLARVIAAHDSKVLFCDGATCSELMPGEHPVSFPNPAAANEQDAAEVQAVIEERFSPRSARRTCEYQAVAAVLRRNVELGANGWCRKLGNGDLFATAGAFSGFLGSGITTAYGRWAPAQVIRVRADIARLGFADGLDEDIAAANLVALLEKLPVAGAHSLAALSKTIERAFAPLLEQRSVDFTHTLLADSSRQLEPLVDDFLDRELEPLTCANSETASSLDCGVRLLVGAIYRPLLDYAVIENPTDADRKRLATLAYRKAIELDPLSRTPLLFNVGLGVNGLTRFGGDDSLHLTLLDKLGLATRWGERNDFELGVFVGGFLDAIIRTTSNAKEQQYWLAGATVGYRQFGSGLPFGLGLHIAAALPFDLGQVKQTALAAGFVLTVPADIAFGD